MNYDKGRDKLDIVVKELQWCKNTLKFLVFILFSILQPYVLIFLSFTGKCFCFTSQYHQTDLEFAGCGIKRVTRFLFS